MVGDEGIGARFWPVECLKGIDPKGDKDIDTR
ncbi:hypothetical protein L905_07255 [Agrobacterium sp. TS43]|nr:hypothetical protein L902_02100 [Agrobacterium radiobacter DSM 30147]KVK49946.1 hypothetical protein L903_18910 [Agrobacterium sp. JL28]KVK50238.1 hypothetical protein L904_18910 [Agrobacterium sp. LY4]KVK54224.1 hypothetical protein L901_17805 [Agrobacterium sp. D14]KVK59280.1 hypothetical protein L905_07255 [Agrobacterium sp. TS43]KVK62994.1 hypothetical protein L906_18040 [Agrobacterium sp. TS45]KVK67518.1 hypothetical protein L907_18010 [Agrobacterium sp. C13]